jgi:hypothetical protein
MQAAAVASVAPAIKSLQAEKGKIHFVYPSP